MHLIRFADLTVEPWRNGAGVTRTVASGAGWRVSIADVAGSGPFSSFPGLDRVIMLCEGPAMAVVVNGQRHDLTRYEPFAFAGEANTSGHVEAPARDLNVMTARGQCRAEVSVVRADEIVLPPAATNVVVALLGTTRVDETMLATLDTVVLEPGASATFDGDGLMAVAVISDVITAVITEGA
jgi:hypothetical protein